MLTFIQPWVLFGRTIAFGCKQKQPNKQLLEENQKKPPASTTKTRSLNNVLELPISPSASRLCFSLPCGLILSYDKKLHDGFQQLVLTSFVQLVPQRKSLLSFLIQSGSCACLCTNPHGQGDERVPVGQIWGWGKLNPTQTTWKGGIKKAVCHP